MQKKDKNENRYFRALNEEVIIKRFEQIILLILIVFCLKALILQENSSTGNDIGISLKQNIETENDNYTVEKLGSKDIAQTCLISDKAAEEHQEYSTSKRIIQNQKIKEVNQDFVGWLSIPDTPIDYPVMFLKDDNDYYLCHDLKKNKSKSGLLVLDKRCSREQDEINILIHGHHMKSGEMFGALERYKDETYCKEHLIIQYSTEKEEREYEVFAVFVSSLAGKESGTFDYYNYININTELEFNNYIKGIKANSLYKSDVYPEYGDRLLTLSTCDYSVDEGRLVVVGREVKNSREVQNEEGN